MKAAQMQEYHRPLELVDLPVPEPSRATDVLVRIGGAGVCATDLHAIDGLMEIAGVSLPRVLGHENAGWVEATGDGVTAVARARTRSQTDRQRPTRWATPPPVAARGALPFR